MGIYARPDSKWWWLWLETGPAGHQREKTAILVGSTVTDRRDSRLKAEAVYRQRMDELGAAIHHLPTARAVIRFRAYAAAYRRDVIAHHKGAEREREMLTVLIRAFGDELLHTIDRDRVRQWMTARRAEVSAATVNRELDLLKSMLRDAVPKYLETSPIVGLKRLHSTPPVRRLLTPDEEKRLLTVATDPQDRALLILGIDTLARLGDLLDLERADRHGRWLHVRDPKSGRAYDVPLSPRAGKALDALGADGTYYFSKFRKAENPRDWRSSVRQRLEYLCAQADPPIPFGKAKRGITFHWATRRTGATRLIVAKRQPVPVVQQLGNWKRSDVLLEIYTEAQRADLARAVGQRLPIHSRRSAKGR